MGDGENCGRAGGAGKKDSVLKELLDIEEEGGLERLVFRERVGQM